ncbi:MAG TPA: class I SAM-dependent methyltransferase [Dokdonella sp.]
MLKSIYVNSVQAAAKPLRASGILARLEGAPKHSFRFWLASQFAVYDAARLAQLDVPWWTTVAAREVERWIGARGGRVRAFEYGSGASTVWLARRCSHVTSVEHDAAFARSIAPILDPERVRLRVVEPTRGVAVPRAGSARRGFEDCDFSAYVDAILDEDVRYDLVVIDGRARVACLARAQERLAPGGLIVFDNSDRRRYRAALSRVRGTGARYRGWTPALPYRSETLLIHSPPEAPA